jgi:hypothetical protein
LDQRETTAMMVKSTKTWSEAELFNLPGDYPTIAGSWIENSKKKF